MSELNIPESWAETSLQNLVKILDNLRKPITAADRKEGPYPYYGANGLQGYHNEFIFDDRLLLIAEDGGHFGSRTKDIAYIIQGKSWVNNHAHVLRNVDGVSLDFLFQFLRRYDVKPWITGVTVPKLNQTKLKDLPVVVPPFSEQVRIAQKIESTFEKIETIEKNLLEVESLLEKYRESLLAKAFRGELVPQDSSDEPASVLLEKIRKECTQNKNGKKGEQEFAPIDDEEKPFIVPGTWEWVKLGEITNQIQYGLTASASKNGTHKFLRITDITNKGVNWDEVPFCSPSKEEAKKLELQNGDILFARTGGTVGKSFLIRSSVKNTVFASYLIKVRPNNKIVLPDFLNIYFSSPSYWNFVTGNQRGAAQPNVNGTTLANLPIPLPPISEQFRIIKKYDLSLMKISSLNENLNIKTTAIASLKESILQKAFEGKLVEQIPSEGTGHELLAKITKEKELQEKSEVKINSKKNTNNKDSKINKTKGTKNGKK